MSLRPGIIRCLALTALVFVGGVSAQSADKRFYLSPMVGYTLADNERGTDNGYGVTLGLGKKLTPGFYLEATGLFFRMDGDGSACGAGSPAGCDANSKGELKGAGIGALIFPLQSSFPNLFGTFKLMQGQANKHPGAVADYSTTLFDAGVGYMLPLTWLGMDFDLRAEALYRLDNHNRSAAGQSTTGDKAFSEAVFNVGALIPLGPYTEVPEEAEDPLEVVAPSPADSDGDGVPDDIDQCPGTVPGAVVDEKGCEKDSDGDGVVDRLDKCPGTPLGTKVDEVGCPIPPPPPPPVDTGCRSPKPGEPVDFNGCAIGDAIILRGVNFNFDKSELTVNAKVILDQVADALIAASAIKVEIGGHTDSKGSDAYNQKLSDRRAKSVVDYLIKRGVDASRMTSKGYGESQPIDTNDTEEGREVNRRVELKIVQ